MMNFIAGGLASYVTLYVLKNPDSQNPETRTIGAGYALHQFAMFGGAPVSIGLPLAVVAAFLVWLLLRRTSLGFEIRAVGQNEAAARAAGIDAGKIRIIAMTLAGGLAGLVGVAEVLGNADKFRLGFSPEYGFLGIAVALLGRNQPAGVVAAAFLFGALHKGTSDLDMETEHVTREYHVSGLCTWARAGRVHGAAQDRRAGGGLRPVAPENRRVGLRRRSCLQRSHLSSPVFFSAQDLGDSATFSRMHLPVAKDRRNIPRPLGSTAEGLSRHARGLVRSDPS